MQPKSAALVENPVKKHELGRNQHRPPYLPRLLLGILAYAGRGTRRHRQHLPVRFRGRAATHCSAAHHRREQKPAVCSVLFGARCVWTDRLQNWEGFGYRTMAAHKVGLMKATGTDSRRKGPSGVHAVCAFRIIMTVTPLVSAFSIAAVTLLEALSINQLTDTRRAGVVRADFRAADCSRRGTVRISVWQMSENIAGCDSMG